MTPKQAIAFVRANGIVLESGRGPVANLAEAIAGAPMVGAREGQHAGGPSAPGAVKRYFTR